MTPPKPPRRLARVLELAAQLDQAMAHAILVDAEAARVLTQARLARLIDTDPATVCRMLQGQDGYVSTWLAAFDAAGYELVLKRKDVA